MNNGYKDIKKAASDEIKVIWTLWIIGGGLWLGLCVWTDGKPVLGEVFFVLLWVLGALATAAAVVASWKVQGKVDRARGETLGE